MGDPEKVQQKHQDMLNDTKPFDPNSLQQIASDPLESIWVSASAGTGKTKVLTDRVLRLLLPRSDIIPGTRPFRILCLTFTKAAANEMRVRISSILSEWAVMDVADLKTTLQKLLGRAPIAKQIEAAQRLFVDVIDSAGGVQIMTIHSFCQSVLGRFPLESGLMPNFKVLEDAQAAALMTLAQHNVLRRAHAQATLPLQAALINIAAEINEEQFAHLVRDMCRERYQLRSIFKKFWDQDGVYEAICRYYAISPDRDAQSYLQDFCADRSFDAIGLQHVATAMCDSSSEEEAGLGEQILNWLEVSQEDRSQGFHEYQAIFLTKSGTPRKRNFPTAKTKKAHPTCEQTLRAEAARLVDMRNIYSKIKTAALTRDLLHLGHKILQEYDALKNQNSALDFDDLIICTLDLLRGQTKNMKKASATEALPWIMFKLDQGLDHILIDEAQDTNPEQWKIIEALCDEFFAGLSARDDVIRTTFTVGDIKQSIYSFQRAAPEEFQHMQSVFDKKTAQAGKEHKAVALNISFRSTRSILALVDSVFEKADLRHALGGEPVHHESFRSGQAGLVELWPLFEEQKQEKRNIWDPPVEVRERTSSAAQLANYTAEQIKGWLDTNELLPAYNRAVQPGDIMILVRTRTAFVDQLVRALKQRNIPVSGVDRMILGEQLAVQDMLAIGNFCLLPEDDLTLGCVLKSPLLGWDEEELFALAYGREESLWQALQKSENKKAQHSSSYLKNLIRQSRILGVYEFFSYILQVRCPADEQSGLRAVKNRLGQDALDPLDELMNAALNFGCNHIDDLQIFLQQQEEEKTEIKRELDEAGGTVRIMTIHGSKGLQAPIVIMPDTILSSGSKKSPRLLWPDKTKIDIPLWAPRKDDEPQEYKKLAGQYESCADEEYYRLLYVAMTRAADRLYIGGYAGKKSPKDESWYNLIRQGLARLEGVQELEKGLLRLESEQTGPPDRGQKAMPQKGPPDSLPQWLFHDAPEEPVPSRPLIPSRPSQDELETAAVSPLSGGREYRFRRGNITHKLLQFLPDISLDNRKKTAQNFVEKQADDLPSSVREEIVREVLGIVNNPDYAPFFAHGSMAEVPVTGLMEDGRIVSGQIDRLVVGESDIWIVDYKTNRPPPREADNVPKIYKKQLQAYSDTIEKIYPGRAIHCALLWTDGPFLTVIQ